jgi:hypothetical protein
MRNCLDPAVLARAEPLAAGQIDWMLLETDFWPLHGDDEHSRHATIVLSCDAASPVGAGISSMSDESHGLSCRYGRGDATTVRPWLDMCLDFGVLYARRSGGLAAQNVDSLVARMKADGVGHVIVVSPDEALRRSLPHADSWIIGSVRTDITTAGVVAAILQNIVHAPATLNCLDFYDLDPPFGRPDAPAVLAEAVHLWDSDRIEFLGPADEAAFRAAGHVALLPVPGAMRLRQVTRLVDIVKAKLGERTECFSWGAALHGSNRATSRRGSR